jgi:transposase
MTIPAATRLLQSTVLAPELYLAFELGQARWKLGFTPGLGQRPRERTIPARDLERLVAEVARAKERFGLPPGTPVVSCYEAGRDGFWLHRRAGSGITRKWSGRSAAPLLIAGRLRRAGTRRVAAHCHDVIPPHRPNPPENLTASTDLAIF